MILRDLEIVLYSVILMSHNNTSSINILLHIFMGNTIRISRMSSRSKTCFILNYVIEDVIKILNNKSRGRLCNGINIETQIGLRHGTFSCHWTHDKNIYSLIKGFLISPLALNFTNNCNKGKNEIITANGKYCKIPCPFYLTFKS